MLWLLAALIAGAGALGYLYTSLKPIALQNIAEEAAEVVEEDYLGDLLEDVGDIGKLEESITTDEIARKKHEQEIIEQQIEKTKAETAFEVETTEWQMETQLSRSRAARGASGLTATGSPLLVLQALADKYERVIAHRELIGELQVTGLETTGDILTHEESMIELRGRITQLQVDIRKGGIEYRKDILGIESGYRKQVYPSAITAGILGGGADILSWIYGGTKYKMPTGITGYVSPFAQGGGGGNASYFTP